MDVAIPTDRNFLQKEVKKEVKIQEFSIEIQRMWNLRCAIIPVII
jgi:hypothetical protein